MAKDKLSDSAVANAAAVPPNPSASAGSNPDPPRRPEQEQPEPQLGRGASPAGLQSWPPRENPNVDDGKRAVVHESGEEIVCRPPPGVAVHTLGPVVISNWRGHVGGKAVSVAHCTPVAGLPAPILKALRETPEQKIGPFDPRPKANQPQTQA